MEEKEAFGGKNVYIYIYLLTRIKATHLIKNVQEKSSINNKKSGRSMWSHNFVVIQLEHM